MEPETNRWPRRLAAVAAALVFIALALVEAFPESRHQALPEPPGSWAAALARVDTALAGHDVRMALAAWRTARSSALGSGQWAALVEVGDAYLRIGDAVDFRRAFVPAAREIYGQASASARRLASVDGLLRVAQAFRALGDQAAADVAAREVEELRANARLTAAR